MSVAEELITVPKRSLWHRMRKYRPAYMIIIPIMVAYVVFTLYPQGWVIAMGFTKFDGLTLSLIHI